MSCDQVQRRRHFICSSPIGAFYVKLVRITFLHYSYSLENPTNMKNNKKTKKKLFYSCPLTSHQLN